MTIYDKLKWLTIGFLIGALFMFIEVNKVNEALMKRFPIQSKR